MDERLLNVFGTFQVTEEYVMCKHYFNFVPLAAVLLAASGAVMAGHDDSPALAVAPFDEQQARQHQEAWAEHLGQPVEVTNSVGMKLRLIPPGEFMMGSPESEKERVENEGPQHRVRITRPFYLGVYEVTQEEYEQVMGTNPSYFSCSDDASGCVAGEDTGRFPVERVTWADAVEFCRRLSAMPAERSAGRHYRLPTEAEWEYSCRAGTTTPFHFGSVLDGRQANCDGNRPYGTSAKGPYLERPTVVGSYSANAFGLYDMHGNVWEWCSDWYDSNYYATSPVDDPPGSASALLRVFRGGLRVFRGGGWYFDAGGCRSAFRGTCGPGRLDFSLGFRVALVPVDE